MESTYLSWSLFITSMIGVGWYSSKWAQVAGGEEAHLRLVCSG